MYSTDDFLQFRNSYDLSKRVVKFCNTFFEERFVSYRKIDVSDMESEEGSLQDMLDSAIQHIEELCCTAGFDCYTRENHWNTADVLDDAFSSFLNQGRNVYIKAPLKNMNVLQGTIYTGLPSLKFCFGVDLVRKNDGEVEAQLSFWPESFAEEKVCVDLKRWRLIIPFVEFFTNMDYAEFFDGMNCFSTEYKALQKAKKIDLLTMELYFQKLCRDRNLAYSLRSDSRGFVVKIRLPHHLCLRFRLKQDEFAKKKDQIEPLIDATLEYLEKQTIRSAVQYYGNSEYWKE